MPAKMTVTRRDEWSNPGYIPELGECILNSKGKLFIGNGVDKFENLEPVKSPLQNILRNSKFAIVICGYPGIGKSWLYRNSEFNVLDSDSSKFSWIYKDGEKTTERNPHFVDDYVGHIKANLVDADIICVSTHLEVRQALEKEHINFVTVYPDINEKDAFLQRYKERGSSEKFIEDQAAHWEERISSIEHEPHGSKLIYLKADQNLSDIIDQIM